VCTVCLNTTTITTYGVSAARGREARGMREVSAKSDIGKNRYVNVDRFSVAQNRPPFLGVGTYK